MSDSKPDIGTIYENDWGNSKGVIKKQLGNGPAKIFEKTLPHKTVYSRQTSIRRSTSDEEGRKPNYYVFSPNLCGEGDWYNATGPINIILDDLKKRKTKPSEIEKIEIWGISRGYSDWFQALTYGVDYLKSHEVARNDLPDALEFLKKMRVHKMERSAYGKVCRSEQSKIIGSLLEEEQKPEEVPDRMGARDNQGNRGFGIGGLKQAINQYTASRREDRTQRKIEDYKALKKYLDSLQGRSKN